MLRTQAQAEYAAENYGHFGLNLRRYAHFTSPIRRYADLVVHRALIRALNLGGDGLPEGQDIASLGEIAARISAAERRAMKAERETNDRLIAHFLADRVGATFEGRISGVTRAGLFVKLDGTGADGFIPARTIGDEYFRYEEALHAMVGNRSGETHRLGDRVTVKLVEAAPVAGALRFELLSEGRDRRRRAATGRAAASGASILPLRAEASPEAAQARQRAAMTDLSERFAKEAPSGHPNRPPRDAATLILLDRSGPIPKVLMGRRHHGHVFLPGRFVFPGGAVDPARPADDGRHAARSARRGAN